MFMSAYILLEIDLKLLTYYTKLYNIKNQRTFLVTNVAFTLFFYQ